MLSLLKKEISSFFSSLIGYVVIGLFVLILGLTMWIFPDFSILYYNYASLDQLFSLAPMIFIFLIPAITMRSFSEELQNGTLEILLTKPILEWDIVLGKYLACLSLAGISLIPTLLYFYSVYQLGSPVGNLDTGAVWASYMGLILLASGFTAIGIFCSSLFRNQIVSFLFSVAFCYIFYFGFYYISKLPVFFGKTDDIVQQIGMDYHFNSINKGLIDSSDVIYFISLAGLFLYATVESLKSRKF